MSSSRWLAIVASLVSLAVGVAACGDGEEGGSPGSLSGQIAGAGATSQVAAQEAWIVGFENEDADAAVSYDPVGSAGGREQFIAGGTAYAGSDAALEEEGGELEKAAKRCLPGQLIEIPAYVSPISIVYNLEGVESLQLDPQTLAKIFSQEITTWDDEAIAADNPGVELPDTRIAPVNRSDESGATESFTEYLSEVVPSAWTYGASGDWPVEGGEVARGASGMVDAVSSADGAIGYADAVQGGKLGVAKIEVGKEYVEPTREATAKLLEESSEDKAIARSPYMFPFELDRETEAEGTYPIALVSYLIACTAYESAEEAAIARGYLEYAIGPAGQKAAAESTGSAPLPASLAKEIEPAVEAIEAGT